MTPPPLPTLLMTLADTLESVFGDDQDHPPVVLGIHIGDGDTVELATKPLSGHPSLELLGFTAPASWCGFGVVARGTARPWPEPGARSPIAPGTPLLLIHLLGRDTTTISRIVTTEGDRHVGDGEQVVGAIHDTCLRVLGLPTPPPASRPEHWEALHRQLVASGEPWAGLFPEDIAWMDAGMLSRWCGGSFDSQQRPA